MSSVRKFLTATLFEYETQKVIAISSYKIGLIYRGIQLLIVTYVVGWVMLREKGYQSFDTVVSGVTTKLKGLEYTNYTNIPSIGDRIWDVADWAVPPQMNSAFFVTTNVVITKNQSQTTCEEDKDNKWHAHCKTDADCKKGHVHMLGWGVKTGRCVNSTREANLTVCEIYGWCPTERDLLPLGDDKVLMTRVKNFTVLIKNSVEFPKFGVKRRNILSKMTNRYLKTCSYRPNHEEDRYCPIFKLGDIIKYGQAISEQAAKQIWITGGMVAIDIHWECNFDYDEEHCKPEYKFRNLEDGKVGQGWNFRHAYHYVEDGIHKRTLVKAFGIQFFISVTGRGGKFDILNFTMNLGSGLALLTLATVLCDIIVLNIMRKRKKYRQAKIDKVKRKEIERAKTIRDSDSSGRRRGKRSRATTAAAAAPATAVPAVNPSISASLAVSGADLSDITGLGGNNGIPFADAVATPTSPAMLWPSRHATFAAAAAILPVDHPQLRRLHRQQPQLPPHLVHSPFASLGSPCATGRTPTSGGSSESSSSSVSETGDVDDADSKAEAAATRAASAAAAAMRPPPPYPQLSASGYGRLRGAHSFN